MARTRVYPKGVLEAEDTWVRAVSDLFLACRSVRVDPATGHLEQTEVDAFIDRRWLVAVRKNPGLYVVFKRKGWL